MVALHSPIVPTKRNSLKTILSIEFVLFSLIFGRIKIYFKIKTNLIFQRNVYLVVILFLYFSEHICIQYSEFCETIIEILWTTNVTPLRISNFMILCNEGWARTQAELKKEKLVSVDVQINGLLSLCLASPNNYGYNYYFLYIFILRLQNVKICFPCKHTNIVNCLV